LDNIDEGIQIPNLFIKHPLTGDKIPIYVSSYVLEYGSGAVMGVPAHCDNDKAFAFKNNIQSLDVLNEDDQTLINSGAATGLSFEQAKWYIMA
jgi:leucyl-tRNA synthetase